MLNPPSQDRYEAPPSRAVLDRAERRRARRGHELDGFLSEEAGFLPWFPTVRAFPASHAAWDQVVARMPELWRTVGLRRALQEMPVLSAAEEVLPNELVWRASVVLGVFAHAFVRIEEEPVVGLPLSIMVPWRQVSRRLGRREPHMSYNDLVVYNHRLRNPTISDPYTVENMELLVPSVDNVEERRFYLAQVEILARAAPVVSSVVRAQTAVVRDDPKALGDELEWMTAVWEDIIDLSLPKVAPNFLADTYIDQVVWANTVAPLAVPIRDTTVGPGGEASPIFHLMDVFLGRQQVATRLGREVAELREWFPRNHVDFLRAVRRVSVRDYVAARRDLRLRNRFGALFETYAGKRGYLGAHRTKVYGFLEIAFKVGRTKTISRIEGGFRERHWKTLDGILEDARQERRIGHPLHIQYARIQSRTPAAEAGRVSHVALRVDGGVRYRPGDRCAVLPVNPPEAVNEVLAALAMTGNERVPLTRDWQEMLRYRVRRAADVGSLPLRTFLAYASLRPLTSAVASALVACTGSRSLTRLLRRGEVEQWEFRDALRELSAEGRDARRMVTARAAEPHANARVLPPLGFRMYSISSAPSDDDTVLRLTVAPLAYHRSGDGPRASATELSGVASNHLVTRPGAEPLPIRIVRPSRFTLPREPTRPVVMFATGVGVAPFLGFIAARAKDPDAGDDWLFLGTKTRQHIYGEDEITAAVEAGRLALYTVFSQEEGGLRADFCGPVRSVDVPAGHLNDAIALEPDLRNALWDLARSEEEGGRGAYFYVCGRAEFAHTIRSVLADIVREFGGDDSFVQKMVVDGRYMQDVFSTWIEPSRRPRTWYDVSEVATHTTSDTGQWLILYGDVYDVTEFMSLHPGGHRIIAENVGLDATAEFEAVLHHQEAEIMAMLAAYRIGSIREAELDDNPVTITLPDPGLPGTPPTLDISVRDLHRRWVRFLHLLTEMANALANDWAFLTSPLTRGEESGSITALKVQRAGCAHSRFMDDYRYTIVNDELPVIRTLTAAFVAAIGDGEPCASTGPLDVPEAVTRFREEFSRAYLDVAGPEPVDTYTWEQLREVCVQVKRSDEDLLTSIKAIAVAGVAVFERLEHQMVDRGADLLLDLVERVPAVIEACDAALLTRLAELRWNASLQEPDD